MGLVKIMVIKVIESPISSHGLATKRRNIFAKVIGLDNRIDTLLMR